MNKLQCHTEGYAFLLLHFSKYKSQEHLEVSTTTETILEIKISKAD